MANYKRHELQTQFKKAYNTISQAGMQMRADGVATNALNASTTQHVSQFLQEVQNTNSYYKYFKTIGKIDNDELIFLNFVGKNDYYTDLAVPSKSYAKYSKGYILADGSWLRLLGNSQCKLGEFAMWGSNYSCFLYVIVDTNGPNKKPNRLGYDVFTFEILSSGQVVSERLDYFLSSDCPVVELGNGAINEATLYENQRCFSAYALADKSPEDLSKKYFKDFLKF